MPVSVNVPLCDRFVTVGVTLLMVGVVMFLLIRSMNKLQDDLQDDEGANDHAPQDPDNKKCVYCRSTIAYRAVRCPNCTSELPLAKQSTRGKAT